MSFREKSAWIMFVTVALAAAAFFGAVVLGDLGGWGALHVMLLCALVMVALQVALHVVAAKLTPADARGPRDERERAVELRSHAVGYYVLTPLVLALFITAHATHRGDLMMYHALAAVAVSTLAIYLTQIILFRSGR